MTPEEWKALDNRVAAIEKFKQRKADNQAIIDRIKGVPAQSGTLDSDNSANNPNVK